MRHHTFICGTSKSREADAYYIYHNDRFWGLLHEVGLTDAQIDPEEYWRLGREYGIYLTEVVDPDEYRVAKDADIEPRQIRCGLETLVDRIESHDPNRIAFVGKNAATWFYRFQEGREITHSQASGHQRDRRNLEGPELPWDYLDLDYFMLTNTHRHWDEDVWADFWRLCIPDVETFKESTSLE